MDFFDPDKEAVVNPREMVRLLTASRGVREEDLSLPCLAIVAFSRRLLDGLVRVTGGSRCEAWHGRNPSLFLATVGNRPVALTKSPYGAPGAVILLEELIAFGVKRTVFLGYCGSIQEEVGVGDIVLPTYAVREDGTSHHYLPQGARCQPDSMLFDGLNEGLRQSGVSAKVGPVWTTDALYRETDKKVRRYRGQGILAVDMEISALFAVGEVRRVSVAALLLVSDCFSRKGWTPGFFDPPLREMEGVLTGLMRKWIEAKVL
jgi:purine-nucleoside phosphorylase